MSFLTAHLTEIMKRMSFLTAHLTEIMNRMSFLTAHLTEISSCSKMTRYTTLSSSKVPILLTSSKSICCVVCMPKPGNNADLVTSQMLNYLFVLLDLKSHQYFQGQLSSFTGEGRPQMPLPALYQEQTGNLN
jgi:hypothetical protein